MDFSIIFCHPRWIIRLLFCLFVAKTAFGYNVLVLAPFCSVSHRLVIDPVAETLAKRGNNVTILSSIKELRAIPGVTFKYMEETEKEMTNDKKFNFFSAQAKESEFLDMLLDLAHRVCESTFRDPLYQELLAIPRAVTSAYDVVVIDGTFNECSLALAYHMGVPAIYFATAPAFQPIIWNMNIPYPLSYLMSGFGDTIGDMTFLQRAKNVFYGLASLPLRHNTLHPRLEEVVRRYVPDAPSLVQLERDVSFLLANTHVAIYPSAPSMPYFVSVGCLSCNEAKKLPKDLDDFFNSSGPEGVIFFSLGSYTKGNTMPVEFKNKVIEAFSKIPQKVLWKFEAEIDNLPKNVKLTKWAPQQDLLAHPNLRLFITHGGGLSTQEAAYHGAPILGFPLAVDQVGNIAHAVHRGFGEVLKWRDFQTHELVDLITKMTSDSKYKTNAEKVSRLMKDNAQDPRDTAAFYIEYVARHKGAPHLKSGADNLNLFQYLLLDIFGAALLVLVIALSVVFLLIRSLCRCFFGKKLRATSKTKKRQ